MKKVSNILLATILYCSTAYSQTDFKPRENKGRIAFAFGVNRSSFDLSDFILIGDDYNFTLNDFDGNDGLSGIDPKNFNIKAEYYLHNNLSIGIGFDNYTYQGANNRLIQISGQIDTGDFAGQYIEREDVIRTTEDFIFYRYNKLTSFNLNLNVHDDFYMNNSESLVWSYYFGIGGGILMTESEISLFGSPAYTNNNGMSGFSFQVNAGTRIMFGPAFIDLGTKIGGMSLKNIGLSENALGKHQFIFTTGIASVGLTHQF